MMLLMVMVMRRMKIVVIVRMRRLRWRNGYLNHANALLEVDHVVLGGRGGGAEACHQIIVMER